MSSDGNAAGEAPRQRLLAVDIGLRTGLALFDSRPQLLWYRSHHLPTPAKLKRFVASLLHGRDKPDILYLEGGGPLAEIWLKDAKKLAIPTHQISAEDWRKQLLIPRQFSSGSKAKKEADPRARELIARLSGKKPTSLRHDTAEAILVGVYALEQQGWM